VVGQPAPLQLAPEYQGQIIAKGQGIGKAGGWSVEERERALAPILERIRATMQCYLTTALPRPPLKRRIQGMPPGIVVAHNQEMDGVEIRFSAKPAPYILARLKAHGFHWSVRQHLWYARFSDSRWAVAQAMATA
jgi:hypothetical protein